MFKLMNTGLATGEKQHLNNNFYGTTISNYTNNGYDTPHTYFLYF